MVWKILVVKPDTKRFTTHKLFAIIIKFFIMSKIEVIDVPTSSYRLAYLDFLLFCWIYFRLEAL